jgi:hypothetical protein
MILSDFFALVDPIMVGQAYRGVIPESATAPYAKFFRVSGVEGVTLDQNGGVGNETETRIQIDIYGTAGDVDAKVNSLKAALKAWHVSNTIVLEHDGYEDEVKLHRTTLDILAIHQ